jgi:hypothetical protein
VCALSNFRQPEIQYICREAVSILNSKKMGVFRIKNLITGKCLVGSSTDLTAKWNSQKLQLETGTHPIPELQQDWKKYGEENFVYEIVDEFIQKEDKPADVKKEVKALEELWLDEFLPLGVAMYNKK